MSRLVMVPVVEFELNAARLRSFLAKIPLINTTFILRTFLLVFGHDLLVILPFSRQFKESPLFVGKIFKTHFATTLPATL